MNTKISKADLLKNRFSEKDIAKFDAIINREDDEKITYNTLITDLKKRFVGGCICLLILMAFMIPTALEESLKGIISYAITFAISFTITYVFTPLKPGWKAFFYQKIK